MSLKPIEKWEKLKYDLVHFFIAGIYFILLLITFYVFIILLKKNGWKKLSPWQKIFHPLLFIGLLIRSVGFILYPLTLEGMNISEKIIWIIVSLPSFLFFSDYLIILFLWAEIYHHRYEEKLQIGKLKPFFISINMIMYLSIFILFLLDIILYPENKTSLTTTSFDPLQKAIIIFDLSLYLLTSLGFLLYGLRIYIEFKELPIYNKKWHQVLKKIQIITLLVTLCFLSRVVLVFLSNFIWDLSDLWYFEGIYYFLLEFFPLALMLFLLHGDGEQNTKSNKKIMNNKKGGYHPINIDEQ